MNVGSLGQHAEQSDFWQSVEHLHQTPAAVIAGELCHQPARTENRGGYLNRLTRCPLLCRHMVVRAWRRHAFRGDAVPVLIIWIKTDSACAGPSSSCACWKIPRCPQIAAWDFSSSSCRSGRSLVDGVDRMGALGHIVHLVGRGCRLLYRRKRCAVRWSDGR